MTTAHDEEAEHVHYGEIDIPIGPVVFWSVAGALIGVVTWLVWDILRQRRTVREAERITEIASTVVQATSDDKESTDADETDNV